MFDRGSESINKNKLINRRMFILGIAKAVVFTGIIGRLFTLQISENKKYAFLSDKNRLREWKLPPKRGIIKDFFDNTIADNTQVFQLHVIPEEVDNFNYLILRLSNIIQLDKNDIRKIYKKKAKQLPWQTLIVSNNLSWKEFSKLNLFLHELPGVKPVFSVARKYPQGKNLTHVLGYVAEASVEDIQRNNAIKENHVPGLRVGKTGLERSLENELIGTAGLQRYEVNAYGKRVNQVDHVEGVQGKHFVTTIDSEVQNEVQKLLLEKSGSICVMDIYSGDILAMGSSPSFDPNLFVHGINHKEWNEIINNPMKPMLNKTVSGLYSPGSAIKPIVALSALEHDVINPKMIVKCEGHTELYGQKYHCWKKKGHGFMNLREGIKQSCDIYFYEVARRLGVDRLSITAKKFGLQDKVLKDYFTEEKKGIVPSTKWKRKVLGSNWVLGETLITGIGQGYIQTTPIELCLMTAQIANGGFKIKPRIIYDKNINFEEIKELIDKKIVDIKEKKESKKFDQNEIVQALRLGSDFLSPLFRNYENIKFVQDAMYAVMNEPMGTAYRSRFKNKKYSYAGKTGTSQVKRITEEERLLEIKNKDKPYEDRDHAVFIAFAPYKNPRYAITVLIEHGGSGSSGAAPLARKIIKLVIDRHELREKIRAQKELEV